MYHVYELGNLTGGGGLDIRQKKGQSICWQGILLPVKIYTYLNTVDYGQWTVKYGLMDNTQ